MSKSSPTKFEVKPPTTVPGATSSDRKADYEIHPLFIQRWSPRAFTGEEIPDAELISALEAARGSLRQQRTALAVCFLQTRFLILAGLS